MYFLFVAAVIPVLLLGLFIYKKDIHKEPGKLLAKIFGFGALIAIPVIIVGLILDPLFPTDDKSISFVLMFFNLFFSVGLVEEGFKWLVAYKVGYKSSEFDEIYDIIVYSVFASLGFACLENILYVAQGGISTAILRALLSIPGHTCFGVLMGYFMAKAKTSEINGSSSLSKKNLIFSLIVPALFHTAYDTFAFKTTTVLEFLIFLGFDIMMVVLCFIIVNKTSKVQLNFSNNLQSGVITQGQNGIINYNYNNASNGGNNTTSTAPKFCPICGKYVEGLNFCPGCGFKLK